MRLRRRYPLSSRDKSYLYAGLSMRALAVDAQPMQSGFLKLHGTGVKGVCVRAGVQVCGFTVSGSDWPRSENAIKRVVQKQADRKSQLSSEACASDRIVNIREHSTQITSSTDSSLQTDPTVTIKKGLSGSKIRLNWNRFKQDRFLEHD